MAHHDTGGFQLGSGADVFGELSFASFLQALGRADSAFVADIGELNNSDARGSALLIRDDQYLTVLTAADGVEAGRVHPQHIHGFENGQDAVTPTLAQDDDRDGFIELAEGADTYGPILLSLNSPAGSGVAGFPAPTGDSFLFGQTYDLDDAAANGDFATLLDEAPLQNREIVLHGLTTLEGHGAGTEGEVDGSAGYKAVLPIAAGEIRTASAQEALLSFGDFLAGVDAGNQAAMLASLGTEMDDECGDTEFPGGHDWMLA